MTTEALYQILKKRIEGMDLTNLGDRIYTAEYDKALAEYYICQNERTMPLAIADVREMETKVKNLLTEHLFKQLLGDQF